MLSHVPFGPETHSTRDPTISPSALGRGRRAAVVGGSGFHGRYLVADLLRFTGAQVLVASRRPQRLRPTDRLVPIACDLRDPRALRDAIRGSAVVVHCAGPFQRLPLEPLRAAIATDVHYVDISEDRAYRRQVLTMDTQACAAMQLQHVIRPNPCGGRRPPLPEDPLSPVPPANDRVGAGEPIRTGNAGPRGHGRRVGAGVGVMVDRSRRFLREGVELGGRDEWTGCIE
jgi:NAD(P)-dependent dehydrogenase (short-subunit alcohol dehydrogenase family)